MTHPVWQNAIVIYANWHQAEAGRIFRYRQVQSRFLVWCVSGGGRLEINGEKFSMTPGVMLFAPWNHAITYLPNPEKPFFLGCIHLIPNLKKDPHFFGAYHVAAPESAEYLQRHDEELPGCERTVRFDVHPDQLLPRLGAYVIDRYQRNGEVTLLRESAQLLRYEIEDALRSRTPRTDSMPTPMRNMLNVIESYLEDVVSVAMLARAGNLSQAGVYRYFQRHLGAPPGAVVTQRRLERAAALLRTTDLGIGEIARRLRFADPFYFSKSFKRRYGLSPRAYRNSAEIPFSEPAEYRRFAWDKAGKKHFLYLPERELR